MSLWIELGISTILLFLTIVGSVYVTRVVTVPLIREVIAAAQKRRFAKQQKAGN